MKQYTNYEFYIDTYMGNMSEEDFDRLIVGASYEVCKNIFDKDYTGYEDEVQLATCSVADILYEIEKLENKKNTTISGKTFKSESVGDYSRTFDTANVSDIEVDISNQKEKIKEEIRRYLLMTGLLYRGV